MSQEIGDERPSSLLMKKATKKPSPKWVVRAHKAAGVTLQTRPPLSAWRMWKDDALAMAVAQFSRWARKLRYCHYCEQDVADLI